MKIWLANTTVNNERCYFIDEQEIIVCGNFRSSATEITNDKDKLIICYKDLFDNEDGDGFFYTKKELNKKTTEQLLENCYYKLKYPNLDI